MDLKKLIRDVPDFPKKDILFKDISPLLASSDAIQYICKEWQQKVDLSKIDLIAGIESRGFIFASMLATQFQKGFLPIRKAGKLPPPVIQESYQLEYGSATLEIQKGSGRLLLVDDVLATGGTLRAAINLCEKAGFQVMDVAVLINLRFLNQFQHQQRDVLSLIEY